MRLKNRLEVTRKTEPNVVAEGKWLRATRRSSGQPATSLSADVRGL